MLHAKDVSGKKFEKAAFGYKQDEVDEFLREIAQTLSQLQKEKDDSDKKIDVLADKIRDYMRDEEVIKEALLGAQRQGRQVIEEAQQTSSKIIEEANYKADAIIGKTRDDLEKEKLKLSKIQKEVSDFKANLLILYKHHLDLITGMPDAEDNEIEEQKQIIEEKSEQIEAREELVEENKASSDTKKHSFPFTSAASTERYTDLKFGNNSK